MFQFLVLLQTRLQLSHTKRHVRRMLRQVTRREGCSRQGHIGRTRLFRDQAGIQIGHQGHEPTRFGVVRRRVGTQHVVGPHGGHGSTQFGTKFGRQ